MSERKVLNKYYPPDFDPSKIPRLRLPKTRQYTVRLMAPCNMRCNTCGDYIAKGKKFNARKETVDNECYLGLKVFRFYFKCPRCMAEITFKTDPKNMDYEVEHGATPNFKALKLAEQQAVQEEKDRQEDEKLNPMKLLENRTKQSRREMENMEALEDLKELNQRNRALVHETNTMLEDNSIKEFEAQVAQQQQMERELDIEEQELLAQINGSKADSDESSDEETLPKFGITFSTIDKEFTNNTNNSHNSEPKDSSDTSSKQSLKRKIEKLVVVKKKLATIEDKVSTNSVTNVKTVNSNNGTNIGLNLCAYSSSDSD